MDPLSRLEAEIRYTFLERSRLETALTHPSHMNEHARIPENDDGQYAFLGDAVIGLALADRDITGGKGNMTKERAAKAKNEELAKLASKLALPLRLGEGEKSNAGGERTRLADAIEAVIGAVYRDAGPAHALKVAKRLLNEGPAVVSE